jgi:hypothetical protein
MMAFGRIAPICPPQPRRRGAPDSGWRRAPRAACRCWELHHGRGVTAGDSMERRRSKDKERRYAGQNHRTHWQYMYATKGEREVSWFKTTHSRRSPSLRRSARHLPPPSTSARGASHLADLLLQRGFLYSLDAKCPRLPLRSKPSPVRSRLEVVGEVRVESFHNLRRSANLCDEELEC